MSSRDDSWKFHHTIDCNEAAIYYGGKCTCDNGCNARIKTGHHRKPEEKVTHVCESPSEKHPGRPHRCGCGHTWED